ncbi:MAG: response regulator [Promethearchaeota archaeon]
MENTNGDQHLQNQGKILIIDDERLLRQSLQKILLKSGFHVETAFDYPSAKKCVQNLAFDLLLTDIVLPKISGLKLIMKLQQECELEAATIFITGEPNLETCKQAIKLGASDYLEKPVDRVSLLEAIKNALLRRKHTLLVYEGDQPTSITLSTDFLAVNEPVIEPENKKTIITNLENIHDALSTLKNRYGKDFSEDQRDLLNIVAQNNSQLKKLLKKTILNT